MAEGSVLPSTCTWDLVGTQVRAPSPGLGREETGSQDGGLNSTGPCEEVGNSQGTCLV